MLKPALLYKEEVENKFAEIMYNDDYFLYSGYAHSHELPNLEPVDNIYQWAIVNSKNEVIGYFSYRIQTETDTAYNFGLYSFNKGNPIIGRDVFGKMEELVKNHRRVEWRVIEGNPVIKHYDKFCKKHKGNKVKLHSVTKDPNGNYRDEYWYEILKEGIKDEKVANGELSDNVFNKIRTEINEFGSICVQYTIKSNTEKGIKFSEKDIELLVENIIKQTKQQVLNIIDKYINNAN